MKPFDVLCINKTGWLSDKETLDIVKPEYLGVYSVTEEKYTNGYYVEGGYVAAGIWYRLAGFKAWYHSYFFIRLPDLSADEMSEEARESIVNLENELV